MALDYSLGILWTEREVKGVVNYHEDAPYTLYTPGENDPYNGSYIVGVHYWQLVPEGAHHDLRQFNFTQYDTSATPEGFSGFMTSGSISASPGLGCSATIARADDVYSNERQPEYLEGWEKVNPEDEFETHWGGPRNIIPAEYTGGYHGTCTLGFSLLGSDGVNLFHAFDSYQYNGLSNARTKWSYSGSVAYSVKVQVEYEKRIKFEDPATGTKRPYMWWNYLGGGGDPNGIPHTGRMYIYYVPTGNVKYIYTLGEQTQTIVKTNEYVPVYGIDSSSAVVSTGVGSWSGSPDFVTATAEILFDGVRCNATENESIYFTPEESSGMWGKTTLEAGVVKAYNAAYYDALSTTYSIVCPAHTLSIGVGCHNKDGDEVAAECEFAIGTTTANSGVPVENYYGGKWSFALYAWTPTCDNPVEKNDVPGGDPDKLYADYDVGGSITNLAALGQPTFGMWTSSEENSKIYDDRKLEARLPISRDNAITFTAASTKALARNFASGSWVLSSGLTQEIVGGKLVVTVPANAVSPKISQDMSAVSLHKARCLELSYTSTDAADSPTGLVIAGRQWAVTKASNVVDSITPDNLTVGGSSVQGIFTGTDAPIGSLWSIRSAGTVEVTLKPGFVYTFDGLYFTRAESNRSVKIDLDDDAFVGGRTGDPRDSLDGIMMPLNSDRYSRKGVIVVDGARCAEFYAVKHTLLPVAGESCWEHGSINLGHEHFVHPPLGGFLSADILDDNLPAVFLCKQLDDPLTAADSVTLAWHPKGRSFGIPYGELANINFSVDKVLSGDAYIRVINANGAPAKTVTLNTYVKAEKGVPFATREITLDSDGCAYLGSLEQPTTKSVPITGAGSNYINVSGISQNYIGYKICVPQKTDDTTNAEPILHTPVLNQTGYSRLYVASIPEPRFIAGDYAYIELDYRYELVVGDAKIDFVMRNRNTTYIQLVIHAGTGDLLFATANGDLIFGAYGDLMFDA